MSNLIRSIVSALALLFLTQVATADDWTADKLRGAALQLIDNQWQPLVRGDVVPDSRVIRTLATGHIVFTQGAESVEIGPNTQIQIYDRQGKKPFTTIKQYFGTVTVDAQVENVQHFAVDTPFLAAVVKGTRFSVTSGTSGATVNVLRGHVAVTDRANRSHVTVSAGQSASVSTDSSSVVTVAGSGALPAVLDANGAVVTGIGQSSKEKTGNGNSDNENGNSGSSHGGSGDGSSGGGNDGNNGDSSDGED